MHERFLRIDWMFLNSEETGGFALLSTVFVATEDRGGNLKKLKYPCVQVL